MMQDAHHSHKVLASDLRNEDEWVALHVTHQHLSFHLREQNRVVSVGLCACLILVPFPSAHTIKKTKDTHHLPLNYSIQYLVNVIHFLYRRTKTSVHIESKAPIK